MLFLVLLTFASLVSYAIPNGCYYSGRSNSPRKHCEILISGDSFNCLNREGEVIARWTIVSDNDGRLTLKSEYGATAYASWYTTDDGEVRIEFNYKTYRSM